MIEELIQINNLKITAITPTICKIMHVDLPSISSKHAIKSIIDRIEKNNLAPIQKCLIYAPDAIGSFLLKMHSSYLTPFDKLNLIRINLRSVFPPKTPVCFASMFTGALPEIHGIKMYEKPVLQCDTIFDAFIRAGKKIAIVAVKNSSIDTIFRNRKLDYFSETYDQEITERVITILKNGEHDLIIAYHQEYDDQLHATFFDSKETLEGFKNHIRSYLRLINGTNKYWRKYNRVVAFCPDHGAHTDSKTGKGAHDSNIPEDMQVEHFFSIKKSEK